MNVNDYLGKQYPYPPCWALVADVYASELGQGVTDYKTINHSVRSIANAFRLALHKSPHGFRQVDDPVDYCVVLLAKTKSIGVHHCGVYYGGRVLHAHAEGNFYQDMASLRDAYEIVEFWAKP